MKKFMSLIVTAAMLAGIFTGCSAEPAKEGGIKIVTTVFPIYDWVRNIAGTASAATDIELLLDSGTDLHSYQPTVQDIMTISDCDLFIYVGGESDEWVEDALAEAVNKDMVVLNLLDELGDMAKEEEDIPGIAADEEEEEEGIEYDEHIWLSLRNADKCCEAIRNALIEIDPDNTDAYRVNATEYRAHLTDLDTLYTAAVDEAPNKTLLFGDRFPFRYLVDDYGLDYYAAFSGCSAETEASFETIIFLASKADELGLKYIMKIDGSSDRIPESIISNTSSGDLQILTLDSMQSVSSANIAAGVTYLSIMESNLEVLRAALS